MSRPAAITVHRRATTEPDVVTARSPHVWACCHCILDGNLQITTSASARMSRPAAITVHRRATTEPDVVTARSPHVWACCHCILDGNLQALLGIHSDWLFSPWDIA